LTLKKRVLFLSLFLLSFIEGENKVVLAQCI